MLKEKLIEELSKLPAGTEVCIFDFKRNIADDCGEGSAVGIYKDFDVEMITEKEIPTGVKPFGVLSFNNDEFDDEEER